MNCGWPHPSSRDIQLTPTETCLLCCMSFSQTSSQTHRHTAKGTFVKFTMACEDLQLSSPRTNTSTTPPGNNSRENRASSLGVRPSQSTKVVLSPQPHTTKTTRFSARDRASPDKSIYEEREEDGPHVSQSNPGYHSQNALASNRNQDVTKHIQTLVRTPSGL